MEEKNMDTTKLNLDELRKVSGGGGSYMVECQKCGHQFGIDLNKSSYTCPKCGHTERMYG